MNISELQKPNWPLPARAVVYIHLNRLAERARQEELRKRQTFCSFSSKPGVYSALLFSGAPLCLADCPLKRMAGRPLNMVGCCMTRGFHRHLSVGLTSQAANPSASSRTSASTREACRMMRRGRGQGGEGSPARSSVKVFGQFCPTFASSTFTSFLALALGNPCHLGERYSSAIAQTLSFCLLFTCLPLHN